jgi:hypothetical protein
MLKFLPVQRQEPTLAPTPEAALRELEREYRVRERIFRRMVDQGMIRMERAVFRQACLDMAIDALRGLPAEE